ncbi:MAG: CDGSH iron-sulfur domain-containing protein [Woeseiaceae bacterium]
MAKKTVFKYPGEKATVSWNGPLCIHVAECGRAKGELFIGGRDPWCKPDVTSNEEVAEIVKRCPTGALTVDFADGSGTEQPESANTVHVAYNGPLFVRGRLAIENAPADAPGLAFRSALCRCGKSRNKPFCDNSHEKDGFSDYGAVGETGAGDAGVGGELAIKPIKDGPLMLIGNVTIRNSSGREAWKGDRVALCRCGESANKPFCDGAHKRAGFKSE